VATTYTGAQTRFGETEQMSLNLRIRCRREEAVNVAIDGIDQHLLSERNRMEIAGLATDREHSSESSQSNRNTVGMTDFARMTTLEPNMKQRMWRVTQ